MTSLALNNWALISLLGTEENIHPQQTLHNYLGLIQHLLFTYPQNTTFLIIVAQRGKKAHMPYANSKGPDERAHLCIWFGHSLFVDI